LTRVIHEERARHSVILNAVKNLTHEGRFFALLRMTRITRVSQFRQDQLKE
jgi:hypothetical protein